MSLARSTFRTLCVRSCDGYYFPISFSTTREHFETDQATCNQLCPQAEANIYYHSRTQGPEEMISLDEKPYSDLPAAFSYRTSLNPSCSCGLPQPVELTDAKDSDTYEAQPAQLPRPRSTPGEDPETLANREGRFMPEPFASSLATAQGGKRSVRIAGALESTPAVVSSVPTNFPFDLGLLAEAPRRSPLGAPSIEAVATEASLGRGAATEGVPRRSLGSSVDDEQDAMSRAKRPGHIFTTTNPIERQRGTSPPIQ